MGDEIIVPTKTTCMCLLKMGNDEPLFALRAQDKSAPKAVQAWIDANKARLGSRHPKITGARAIIRAMKAWSPRKHAD